MDIKGLRSIAKRIRHHVLTMSAEAQVPHVASALSCVDILVSLYFEIARLDPDVPETPNRDRIILSKGHASAALYACLAERRFFPVSDLKDYALDNSPLVEHPSHHCVPGVEVTTGSLGHGLGIGCGMAYASLMDGRTNKVFVVLSDGECNEGSTWEAALWAPAKKLHNLVAVVDFNKLQATGRSTEITSLAPLGEKWKAFGWNVQEVNGHDLMALRDAFTAPSKEQPSAIIAHTVKGKGVSFMEDNIEWHYRSPGPVELEQALTEIDRSLL